MTGNTVDSKRFDNWIAINYNDLQNYCKRYRIEEDLLNDVYINIKDRILRSGFTESYFQTYVKRALRNLMINEGKKQNGKYYIDVHDNNFTNIIEGRLKEKDEIEKDTQHYREEIMYLSKMIFKYINEKKYDDEWQFVFRSYYLMPQKFTYAKLTQMTRINKNTCTKIIQTMKKDIRTNFLTWLNGKRRSN